MAHGLVLRMKDHLERLNSRRESPSNAQVPAYVRTDSEDTEVIQIISSWQLVTKNSQNSKMEFISLLRQTLLFMFSSKWAKCGRTNELLHAFRSYYQKFSTITKNVESIYKCVVRLAADPWKNPFFRWEDLQTSKLSIQNVEVQRYFSEEPEEIVSARIQFFVNHKNFRTGMRLAKLSFLYHCRVKKSLGQARKEQGNREGHPSLDWFLSILAKFHSLSIFTKELSQFNCHEGVEMICRMRKKHKRLKKFSLVAVQIFVMQDLLKPSKYCCTKDLFHLLCSLHKELHSSEKDIIENAQKVVALHAPTSAHLYLFVDAMWEHFGLKFNSFIQLYAEFYIRGLTADINYLEVARSSNTSCDIACFELHISSIFAKLSTLFKDSSEEAARECMFSAFSLKPSKSRLLYLKNLNNNVQRKLTEMSENLSHSELAFRDCTCSRICNGYCRMTTVSQTFIHPLLKNGIRNISYSLVKDFVCVLESVRILSFQYNSFTWSDSLSVLFDHLNFHINTDVLEERNREKDSKNKTLSDENSNSSLTEEANVQSPQALIKRKNSSENKSQFLDVAANIEVNNDDGSSKKMKMSNTIKQYQELNRSCSPNLRVKDAVEKVIRLSLSGKIQSEKSKVFSTGESLNFQQHLSPHVERPLENVKVHPTPEVVTQKLIKDQVQRTFVEKQSPIVFNPSIGRPSVLQKTNVYASQQMSLVQKGDMHPSHTFEKSVVTTNVPRSFGGVTHSSEHRIKFSTFQSQLSDLRNEQSVLNLSSRHSEPLDFKHSSVEATNLGHKVREITSQSAGLSRERNDVNSLQSAVLSRERDDRNCPQSADVSKERNDRNSVIQHTMQHLGIKIPNQLSVSINTNTAQQAVKKVTSPTLSPFKVKVPTKNIPKNNSFLPANLVIRHPSGSKVASTQSVQSSHEKREVITIPGILASTSVIKQKPLWGSPRCEYKNVTMSSVKESYSHQDDMLQKRVTEITKKETVYQIYKSKQDKNRFQWGTPDSSSQYKSNTPIDTSPSIVRKNSHLNYLPLEGPPESFYKGEDATESRNFLLKDHLKSRRPEPYARSSDARKDYRLSSSSSQSPPVFSKQDNVPSILHATLSAPPQAGTQSNYKARDSPTSYSQKLHRSLSPTDLSYRLPSNSPMQSQSQYDPSLYSSPVLLEDEKGVVMFKAANAINPSNQVSGEISSMNCCSPLEVNPCQSCTVSSDSKSQLPETSNEQGNVNCSRAYLYVRNENRWIHR